MSSSLAVVTDDVEMSQQQNSQFDSADFLELNFEEDDNESEVVVVDKSKTQRIANWADESQIESAEQQQQQQQPNVETEQQQQQQQQLPPKIILSRYVDLLHGRDQVVIFDAQFNTINHKTYPAEICVMDYYTKIYFHTWVKPLRPFDSLSASDMRQNRFLYEQKHGIYWSLNSQRDELKVKTCNNLLRMMLMGKQVIVRGAQKTNYLKDVIGFPEENIIQYCLPYPKDYVNMHCVYHKTSHHRCAFHNCKIMNESIEIAKKY